jgi:hypothetical protein
MKARQLLLCAVLAMPASLAAASCGDDETLPPPPPPDDCVDPCKLTTPQCGCPDGQMCGYAGGQLGCFNRGTVELGESCDSAACAEGLHCLSFIDPPGYCYAYCRSDEDCAEEGSSCQILLNRDAGDAPARACSIACDLLTGAGCSDEAKCFAFTNSENITFTACVPAGSKMLGDSCASSSECAAGHLCLQSSCAPFCDMTAPSCPDGYSCEGLMPAILVGLTAYGACT